MIQRLPPDLISLGNPMEANPSLLLMDFDQIYTSVAPLFTHNCEIKLSLTTLILNNGSKKNLVTQNLVQHLHLTTIPHQILTNWVGFVRMDLV